MFLRIRNNYTHIFSILHLFLKNGRICLNGFLESLVKTVIWFSGKETHGLYLNIRLVKRHYFSQSIKSAKIAFNDFVKYLQNYSSSKNLMLEKRVY